MKVKKDKPKINEPVIKSANLFPVVGVGASAGGLDAFKKLLKAIPENSGMAYVLVQHLDPNHESMLPEILQKVTGIPVLEITDDIKVQPNHIYIIPSNKMMVATDGVLLLAPRPAKSKTERNLPIDLFFTSLAEVHQTHAIGVVLSGTASDGTLGLKAIKDHGGITFAQDEESAAYEGMPNSAVQAGVVDFILPPEKIPEKLLEVTKIITTPDGIDQSLPLGDEEVFKQIISLLRIRKGTDFTYYKQTTIRRRILRRMALNKNDKPAAYLKYLRENKTEQDILFQDLLIPVTSFFRDTKTFDNLFETVFPLIVKNKSAGETIRVWVAGCSTGEEAYSIAICFKEFLGDHPMAASGERVQIFATDISEPAIAKARMGIYTKIELESVPPQRLKDFFTKINGSYQVNKQVRDMCVFATHNFLKDPPFGKIDFISCRNVLIYMEPYLQKKALTTFHYALNQKGFLLLGKSETTSGVSDLFASSAKNDKLFSRKNVPGKFMHIASQRSEKSLAETNTGSNYENKRTDFQKTADDIILSKYTPAGVVVNEAMDIVHFRGSTGNYLEPSPGKASLNLLKMAKEGLAFELRNILHKAKKDNAAVIKENIPLIVNGSPQKISIEAMPLPNVIEPHYLILFHNHTLPLPAKREPSIKRTKEEKILRIEQLEQELLQAREDMRSITEDQEASNEELQSANEELLSGSEELQSLNEELETSKEELQSTNEELTVVNEEMIGLNEQVTAARDYAEAIVANIRTPLLVLDKNLRIKSANNAFYKIFQTLESETEGKLIYDLGNKEWDIASLRTLLEHILPQKSSIVDYEVDHTFKSIGDRIMLLNAHEIKREAASEKLILLAIQDITAEKTATEKIKESEHRYNTMLMKSPFAFAVLEGKDMVITLANDSIKEVWGKSKNVEGKPLLQVLPEIKDQPFPALLDKVYTTGIPFYGYEILARLLRKGKLEDVYFNMVYQPYLKADKTILGVTIIAYEVTIEVIAKKRIEESEKQFRQLSDFMPQKIWTASAEGNKNYFNQKWLDYSGMSFEELKDWGWKKII
ncbi:MAG: PAS domain S-box protein, partial [Bacteroidia bacterium]|nr:PAS domain S-box protein [Bacteroidia bacterium]